MGNKPSSNQTQNEPSLKRRTPLLTQMDARLLTTFRNWPYSLREWTKFQVTEGGGGGDCLVLLGLRHTKASPSDVSICDGSHSVGACHAALLSRLSLPCLIYISF